MLMSGNEVVTIFGKMTWTMCSEAVVANWQPVGNLCHCQSNPELCTNPWKSLEHHTWWWWFPVQSFCLAQKLLENKILKVCHNGHNLKNHETPENSTYRKVKRIANFEKWFQFLVVCLGFAKLGSNSGRYHLAVRLSSKACGASKWGLCRFLAVTIPILEYTNLFCTP